LFELVVTVGIIAMLSGVFIGYGRTSQAQLVLVNSELKLLNLFARAKSLSVSAFLEGNGALPSGEYVCGYGVHIDTASQEAFIFRELSNDCGTLDNRYTGEDELMPGSQYHIRYDNELAKLVVSSESPFLDDVIFIPPDPRIIINNDSTIWEAYVTIETKGTKKIQSTISVTNAGETTIQRQ
jgi:hypothetical protein